jgi:hypothetical protein
MDDEEDWLLEEDEAPTASVTLDTIAIEGRTDIPRLADQPGETAEERLLRKAEIRGYNRLGRRSDEDFTHPDASIADLPDLASRPDESPEERFRRKAEIRGYNNYEPDFKPEEPSSEGITLDPIAITGSVSRANEKNWRDIDEDGLEAVPVARDVDWLDDTFAAATSDPEVLLTRAPEIARRAGREASRSIPGLSVGPAVGGELVADWLDSGTAGTTGAVQGATLGWSDELGGAIRSILGEDYETARDELRARQDADYETSPAMYALGGLAGSAATLPLQLETLAPRAAAALGTVGTGALEGLVLGGWLERVSPRKNL